jgi:cation diffusion facilitator family transporter
VGEVTQESHPIIDQPTSRPPLLRIGVYSLLVNLSLVGVKLALSFTTGSLALRADAIHSSVDVFGSLALIAGLVIANRRSPSFPYGLYKVENVVSVIISVLLFVTAYEIGSEAIKGDTGVASYGGWVLGVVGAMILVPLLFGWYEVRMGRRYNSPSLTADGRQFRADVLSASIVFFALLSEYMGFPLDRVAAGIVALFIVRAGWGLLSDSMRVLLDASVDADTLDRLRALIEGDPAVSSLKGLTGRNSGRYVFIEASIGLRTSDLKKAHSVSERIQHNIKEAESRVDRVLIHYEPETKDYVRYMIPLADEHGEISKHFGESPYFALVDVSTKENRVLRQEMVANPHAALDKGRGIPVARFVVGYKPDVVVTSESLEGKGPGYVLADAGVKNRLTEEKSLAGLVERLPSVLPEAE